MRKGCSQKKLSNNILTLSQIAAEAKRNNSDVINATIGMLNDSADNFDKMHYDQTFTLRSIANECSCFWVVYSGDSYK